MELQECLKQMVAYLRDNGLAARQKDIAEAAGVSATSLSSALGGNSGTLTRSLLRKINNGYGGIFAPAFIASGTGAMLAVDAEAERAASVGGDVHLDLRHHNADNHSTIIEGDNAVRLALMEREVEALRSQVERLEKENARLVEQNTKLTNSLIGVIGGK